MTVESKGRESDSGTYELEAPEDWLKERKSGECELCGDWHKHLRNGVCDLCRKKWNIRTL